MDFAAPCLHRAGLRPISGRKQRVTRECKPQPGHAWQLAGQLGLFLLSLLIEVEIPEAENGLARGELVLQALTECLHGS